MILVGRASCFVFLLPCVGLACSPKNNGSPDAGADAGAEATVDAPVACAEGGTGWDTMPAQLSATGGGASDSPHVGFDGAGNAIAVWEQSDGMLYSVYGSVRTPDGVWSAPQKISSSPEVGGASNNLNPVLAVSADGSAIAVWELPAGIGMQHVLASHYAPGSGWGAETKLEAPEVAGGSELIAANPVVRMDTKGNGVVAWEENDGQNAGPDFSTQIYVSRYAGGAFSAATRLSAFGVDFAGPNTATQNAGNAGTAIDDAGNAVVVWNMIVENTGGKVQASRFDPTRGSWTPGAYLDTCASSCANVLSEPQAAYDGNHNVLVVYNQVNQMSGGSRGTYATTFSGGTWSMPIPLDPGLTTSSDSHPRVAVDRAGNAVLVLEASNQPHGVYANVLAGGSWKGIVPLDDATNSLGGRPTVAMDDSGNATILWDNQGAVFGSSLSNGTTAFAPFQSLFQGPAGGTDTDLAIAHGGCTRAVAVFWSSAGVSALAQH